MGELFIGTSGFNYKDWKEYPIMNVRFEDVGRTGQSAARIDKTQRTVR